VYVTQSDPFYSPYELLIKDQTVILLSLMFLVEISRVCVL
jgi:hypothetical protein